MVLQFVLTVRDDRVDATRERLIGTWSCAGCILLTPASHVTDGFYIATLQRGVG